MLAIPESARKRQGMLAKRVALKSANGVPQHIQAFSLASTLAIHASTQPQMKILFTVLFWGAWSVTSPAQAEPARYRLDPVHTRVMLAINHAGFSDAIGTVSGSEGELHFDPGDWSLASVDVRVPMARVDMGDARWNDAVAGTRLLNSKKHPLARFVSERSTRIDDNQAEVCGALTLRGVSAPLCLQVRLNQIKRHPMPPFRRTAGFSATAQFSRKAFGIDAWPSIIGDTVHLRIEAEAVLVTAKNAMSTEDAVNSSSSASPAEIAQ